MQEEVFMVQSHMCSERLSLVIGRLGCTPLFNHPQNWLLPYISLQQGHYLFNVSLRKPGKTMVTCSPFQQQS